MMAGKNHKGSSDSQIPTSLGQMHNEKEKDIKLCYNVTNLLVNYLPSNMTEESLFRLFSSIGEVVNCKLIVNVITRKSLGYGFVQYLNSSDAVEAVQMLDGLKIENKILKVSFARPSSPAIKGANLYVQGLPTTMTSDALAEIFKPYGCIIAHRILYETNSNMDASKDCCNRNISKGVAFVRFDKRAEAQKAVDALHGSKPDGFSQPLTVKFAKCSSDDSSQRYVIPACKNSNVFRSTGYWSANDRYSSQLLPCVDYTYNYTWTLYVSNLHPDTTELDLWQLFGPYGAVQRIHVIKNRKYMNRVIAFVEMTIYKEACNAMNWLNNYYCKGKYIKVVLKNCW